MKTFKFFSIVFGICFWGVVSTAWGQEFTNIDSLLIALFTPKITSASPPPLTPGQDYLISGWAFGKNLGQVKMILPSGKPIDLVVQPPWLPTLVSVRVPYYITGEKDGYAAIQVETANHFTSNKVSVWFQATRDFTSLPSSLLQVDCADPPGSDDHCMGVDYWGYGVTDYSFHASHMSMCCFSGDHDTDKYSTKAWLKNGWVIYDIPFLDYYPSGWGQALVTTFIGKGLEWVHFTVEWVVDLKATIEYRGIVSITGPAGVPYE